MCLNVGVNRLLLKRMLPLRLLRVLQGSSRPKRSYIRYETRGRIPLLVDCSPVAVESIQKDGAKLLVQEHTSGS